MNLIPGTTTTESGMASWTPDSPVQLEDGSLVCKAHGLNICGICTVDYTFMQELSDLDDSDSDDANRSTIEPHTPTIQSHIQESSKSRFGTRIGYIEDPSYIAPDVSSFFPSKFQEPYASATPQTLFRKGQKLPPNPIIPIAFGGAKVSNPHIVTHHRFIRLSNDKEILIYTDGACLNNGQTSPRAGCAFVFYPKEPSATQQVSYGTDSFRLENKGPTGTLYEQTSNRAELRAAIAALQFRAWVGEGWERLVIATDSEYVVNGATEWVRGWIRKDWMTAKNTPVKNRDLWELLLKAVRKHKRQGLDVVFWRIPRELNSEADRAAKGAALEEEVPEFMTRMGSMSTATDMDVLIMRLDNGE